MPMKRLVVASFLALPFVAAAQQAPKPAVVKPAVAHTPAAATLLPAEQTALVKQYCVSCHSERGKAGGLSLATFDANDIVALNRLGRAYEATGAIEQALESFEGVLVLDPANAIAKRRIREIKHRREG